MADEAPRNPRSASSWKNIGSRDRTTRDARRLRAQILEDWKKLPTNKLRTKIQRDPQYKKLFDVMMAANELDSVATSYTDGSAEFRR